MVIEDELFLLRTIAKEMKAAGINVLPCIGGKQAFSILSDGKQLPDAIWLDYYLRDTNGLEFMGKLKQQPSLEKIPVFVVSNTSDENIISSMALVGTEQYFIKTKHRLEDIIKTIKTHVSQ